MNIFVFILTHNIIPIFFLIALGYTLGKKFDMHIHTLSKINIYVYVPIFAFMQIYTTDMPSEMLKVLIFVLLLAVLNSVMANLASTLFRYERSKKSAFVNSVMFYNSGNIGIPLITLVFSSAPFVINGKTPYLTLGLTTQIVVLIVQNISTNTVGFFNAGRGTMHWKDSLKSILNMPTIYTVPLAFILKALPYNLEQFPLWPALEYVKQGLISVALLTLGVQLAKTKFSFKSKDVYISNFVRLLGGPLFAFVLLKLLGITGIPAQALMISSALPTAVNTALIAVERNNHPDFASQAVMTSTLFSAITLTLIIYLSRGIFPV